MTVVQVYHGPEELRVTTRHGDGGSPVSASLQEMYGLVNRAKEANSKVAPSKVMVMRWRVESTQDPLHGISTESE